MREKFSVVGSFLAQANGALVSGLGHFGFSAVVPLVRCFSEDRTDYRAMNRMRAKDVNDIVIEALAEWQKNRREDIDAKVLKVVTTKLNSFGIDEGDRNELRADFQHLRWWRRNVEQAQSYIFKAIITVMVTGFVGAVWFGIKGTLGK